MVRHRKIAAVCRMTEIVAAAVVIFSIFMVHAFDAQRTR
jgi:hypothetical protein